MRSSFDDWSKMLAGPVKRREMLRGTLGMLTGAIAGSLGFVGNAQAASLSACRAYCNRFPVAGGERNRCMTVCLNCSTTAALCGNTGFALRCCTGGVCNSGTCTVCGTGQTACGSYCASLASDISNCGHCGTTCPNLANASMFCANGQCGYTCNAGFRDCNNTAADGCEVNISNDFYNCGACGYICSYGQECYNGVCRDT